MLYTKYIYGLGKIYLTFIEYIYIQPIANERSGFFGIGVLL